MTIKIINDVNLLEHVMVRPGMYIKDVHLDYFQCFIFGLTCGNSGTRKKWYDFGEWMFKTPNYKRSFPTAAEPCEVIARRYGWKKRGMQELIKLWKQYNELARTN